jgi:hypothetical protein
MIGDRYWLLRYSASVDRRPQSNGLRCLKAGGLIEGEP